MDVSSNHADHSPLTYGGAAVTHLPLQGRVQVHFKKLKRVFQQSCSIGGMGMVSAMYKLEHLRCRHLQVIRQSSGRHKDLKAPVVERRPAPFQSILVL